MEVQGTDDVAVIIDADYLCAISRGVKDLSSLTITSSYHGKFLNSTVRDEILRYVYDEKR